MKQSISEATDLNYLVQGGQTYLAFPFSKGSLAPALTRTSGFAKNGAKTLQANFQPTVTKTVQPWTNLSKQDKTWAEFSTLDASVIVYAMQILS